MKRKGRLSLQEVIVHNAAVMRGLARVTGTPIPDDDPLFHAPPPKEHKPRTRPAVYTGPTEREIQTAIIDYLRRIIGASVTRHNSGMMLEGERHIRFNSSAGHSDLSGTLPGGRAFFFEVKRPGRKATSAQQRFLDNRARLGALAAVVTSIDDVQKLLAGDRDA
jgi:hypothetical protein